MKLKFYCTQNYGFLGMEARRIAFFFAGRRARFKLFAFLFRIAVFAYLCSAAPASAPAKAFPKKDGTGCRNGAGTPQQKTT